MKGWVGVDLDGTLAYYHEWKGEEHIGEPILDMVDRIKGLLEWGEYDVKIFTARVSGRPYLIPVIQDWLEREAGLPRLPVTCVKDYLCVELWDDRAKQLIPNSGVMIEDKLLHDIREHCKVWCAEPDCCDRCPLGKYLEGDAWRE